MVFRNQGKEVKPKKRFINDTIRSDFHINFMNTVFRQFRVSSNKDGYLGIAHAVCIITPFGFQVKTESPITRLHTGQMVVLVFSKEEFRIFIYSSLTASLRTSANCRSISMFLLFSSNLVRFTSMHSITYCSHRTAFATSSSGRESGRRLNTTIGSTLLTSMIIKEPILEVTTEHTKSEMDGIFFGESGVFGRIQIRFDQVQEDVRVFAGVEDLRAIRIGHVDVTETVGDDAQSIQVLSALR